jgi:hypothetical protein
MKELFEKKLHPDPHAPKIIETSLNVELPEDYKKFVETVGVIDNPELTIYGSWQRDRGYDSPSVIGYTRILRQSIKLPENYIAVQSIRSDEVLLDTETGYMFCWYDDMGKILPLSEYESFEHFVKETLKDMKE